MRASVRLERALDHPGADRGIRGFIHKDDLSGAALAAVARSSP